MLQTMLISQLRLNTLATMVIKILVFMNIILALDTIRISSHLPRFEILKIV